MQYRYYKNSKQYHKYALSNSILQNYFVLKVLVLLHNLLKNDITAFPHGITIVYPYKHKKSDRKNRSLFINKNN
ncbi:hypothetical protein HQ47_08085 [Porphyromonas macacae]|uniref:Uncharacterized protein n=1 Tax=Porphyromonas macacae TaxID=28115 RepID=A0A0A2E7K6_9PORP|nr:hypothetical protein HQ47_08085 [Porphyromonas macacae]